MKENAFGPPGALRAMIAGQERAALVALRAERMLPPEEAFDAAMDLWSLCPEKLHDPPDAVRIREVEQARASWMRLKGRQLR